MNSIELMETIENAFVDAKWKSLAYPEPILSSENCVGIADSIYLFDDDDQKFYLPRLMTFVVTAESDTDRLRCLARLTNFLDVDFDDPENTDLLLKECRLNEVSDYTEKQALAIYTWLKYVLEIWGEKLFIDDREQGLSALKYWKRRAGALVKT